MLPNSRSGRRTLRCHVDSFRLHNAAMSFQRLTDMVFRGTTFSFAYNDEVIIASQDVKEHHDHLQEHFESLGHFGFKINVNKFKFDVLHLTSLGHMMDEYGILPVPEKFAVIQQFL